jgi:hypothetical protein
MMALDEFLPQPPGSLALSPPDPIVSMIEYHGMIFVATTRQVFVKDDGGVLRPLKFAAPMDD